MGVNGQCAVVQDSRARLKSVNYAGTGRRLPAPRPRSGPAPAGRGSPAASAQAPPAAAAVPACPRRTTLRLRLLTGPGLQRVPPMPQQPAPRIPTERQRPAPQTPPHKKTPRLVGLSGFLRQHRPHQSRLRQRSGSAPKASKWKQSTRRLRAVQAARSGEAPGPRGPQRRAPGQPRGHIAALLRKSLSAV